MNLYICKTCNRRIGDDGSNDCPICIPKHLDEPRVWLIEQIGCASHSEWDTVLKNMDIGDIVKELDRRGLQIRIRDKKGVGNAR